MAWFPWAVVWAPFRHSVQIAPCLSHRMVGRRLRLRLMVFGSLWICSNLLIDPPGMTSLNPIPLVGTWEAGWHSVHVLLEPVFAGVTKVGLVNLELCLLARRPEW